MRETFRLQPDAEILPRTVFCHCATVDRLQFEAGDKRAARCFSHNAEIASTFPTTGFAGVFVIDFRLAIDKYISQYTIGFTPRVQHFLPRAEHFVQRCQQVFTDDVVLFRFDLEAGVLLRDFFYRWQQRRQVFNITGVGGNSVKQCFTLIAITLVTHVKNFFEFWVMSKHTVVEMGG